MNPTARSVCTPEAFERRYRTTWDPWSFRTSVYEIRRYETILQILPYSTYSFAFEPGCSIGELTVLLAPRCHRILATDISPTAVERARKRCAPFPHVHIACADVRSAVLKAAPDLIVLSEIAYYFDVQELESLAMQLGRRLREHGTLLAAHWLGKSDDHVLHADEAHEALLRAAPLRHEMSRRCDNFRIDLWSRE